MTEPHPLPPRKLSYEETQKALRLVVLEGIASQTMEALTKGVFLVGLALQLGASNFIIGLLGAIPFLSNLFQLLAVHLIEKYRDRRKIVALSCFIGRSFLLLAATAPFIPDPRLALLVVIIAIATRYSIGALAGCGWNSWMRDLVPKVILGQFYSRRLFATTLVASFVGLGAGFFLDWWKDAYPAESVQAYTVLYVAGFVAAMVSSAMILKIPHPPMPEPEAKTYHKRLTFTYLMEPLTQPNFRKLIFFLMSWNFAINLAAPFFTVYMLKTLSYDMFFVVSLTLMGQIINALTLKLWGKYTDRYSNKNVLAICGSIFIFCIFCWTFTTFPEKHSYTTALLIGLHVVMGVAMAGVNLSTANITMKLTPSRKATSFLAINTILTSLAAGIAPFFGGLFADFFEDKSLSLEFHWHDATQELFFSTLIINHWDFFFICATIIGLYALRRLALIEEEGSVKDGIIIREIMIDTGKILRSLSTVDGLRELTMAPMAMMVNLIRRR